MKKKLLSIKSLYILGLVFILGLFFYIDSVTPLAGDDWCYAVNGMGNNPFIKAFEFYNIWSGRYFSELWGFVLTNNKWAWNIINPLLFGMIYFLIYKIADVKKNYLMIILLIISYILSVDDFVRMETYSWIMGSTYVVPLCLSLVYFYFFEKVYLDKTNKKILHYLNPLLFVGCLMMENISAAMVIALVILTIYCYFQKRELFVPLIINSIISAASFMIMRCSPGAALRLSRDFPEWSELSLIGKVVSDYPEFIRGTFIENNYMIALLSMSLVLLAISSKKIRSISAKLLSIFINVLGVFAVFSFVLAKENNFFVEGGSLFSMLFWPIYTINVFVELFVFVEDEYKLKKCLLFMVVGGSAALAMIMSPLYGARSSLYTIYYVILVSSLLISELNINKYLKIACCVVMTLIIVDRTSEYIFKYNLVKNKTIQRYSDIKMYVENPDIEYAAFERFPIYTIHAVDIEWDDKVHLQAFAEYYNLPQDVDKIYFYAGEGE